MYIKYIYVQNILFKLCLNWLIIGIGDLHKNKHAHMFALKFFNNLFCPLFILVSLDSICMGKRCT